MMYKLGIPNNKIFDGLFDKGLINPNEIQIVRADEQTIFHRMKANLLDAAIFNPLMYANSCKIADYKIIPELCLFSESYSELCSVYFKEGISEIESLSSRFPDDYLIIIANILLAEQYNLHLKIQKSNLNLTDSLKSYDTFIDYGISDEIKAAFDVSEEWFSLYEKPLPIGFWICRAEGHPQNIREIIKSITPKDIQNEIVITEFQQKKKAKDYIREGRIIHKWQENFKESIALVIELLYYHQLIPEIAEVKIME